MALFFIDAVAKATILLAVAGVATTLLRRSSAASRHLVWTVALVASLALPALSMALPRWHVPLIAISAGGNPPAAAFDDSAAGPMADRLFARLKTKATAAAATAPAGAPATTARPSVSWSTMVVIVWLGGAMLVLGRLILGLLAVQFLARRTVSASDASWLPLAQQLATDLGVSKVTFRSSRQASMPMASGISRATVTMPEDAATWPEERLRIVLLHELAHVKRRDCLTHMLAQVACAFYWFNPLAWVAARHVRAERERACDDLVLAAGTPGADYADQLLDIARVMRAGRLSSVAASASLAMAHRSQLEGRLMAILDPTVPRTGISRRRSVAAATIAAMTLIPLASLQAWSYSPQNVPAPVAAPTPAPVPAPAPAPLPPVAGVQPSTAGIQGGVQGGIQDGIRGGIQDGIQEAVQGGIQGGIRGGVAVQNIVSDAVRDVVPVAIDAAISAVVDVQDAKAKADPKVIAALTEALKDSDKDVRETALHALVRLRDPGVFEPLLQALKDGSADVREQAAFGLGQMRDKRAVEPLIAAMKDTAPGVREQAVFALGQLRDPRAVEALIAALKDSNANVREQAAFALGQLRASASVEALVVALKDSNASVREQSAFALGQIRDPRAIDGLTTALKDSNASVRQQAAFALGQLAR